MSFKLNTTCYCVVSHLVEITQYFYALFLLSVNKIFPKPAQ